MSISTGARIDRFAAILFRILSTPHALEGYFSAYAVWWGLTFMMDPAYLDRPYMQALRDTLQGHAAVIGMPMMLLGAIGIWALATGRRWVRAQCALGCAVLWAAMGAYFSYIEPPIWLGLATYGGASAAEGWVYFRVTTRADGPSDVRVAPRTQ